MRKCMRALNVPHQPKFEIVQRRPGLRSFVEGGLFFKKCITPGVVLGQIGDGLYRRGTGWGRFVPNRRQKGGVS